jgi:PAS domain S-box-containing protein
MDTTTDPIRVLHIDDEPDFAAMASVYLERENDRIEATTATSASEGLDRLAGNGFDCIVSDYDMPERDGIGVLEAVRADRADRADLPFILFTGKGSEQIASEAISAGVTDYLQKGSGTDQYTLLANRIHNAVERDRSERALAERKRRLETLIDNLPGIVYRCRNEPDWPMEYVEGDCKALTGHAATTLESGDVSFGEHLIRPADRSKAWEAVQTALASGEPFEVTYRITTADGTGKWLWERGREVRSSTGELEALEGFITDVTDRQELERRLERRDARLDRTGRLVADLRDPLDVLGEALDGTAGTDNPDGIEGCRRGVAELDRLVEELRTLTAEEPLVTDSEATDSTAARER